MATGKETPRQRMIGMMYLVLTALLALQVSSAIIEKFYALNKSMEASVNNAAKYNDNQIINLKDEVKKRGNRSDELKLTEQAEKLQEQSKEVLSFMEKIKTDLIVRTGGYDEDGNLKGAKEETEVEVFMLGSSEGKGKAYELQKRLNDYILFVNKTTGSTYPKLALDAKEDPLYKNNVDQKNKDFAQVNFAQTPLVAAMAVISDLETKITGIESTCINQYLSKVGLKDFKVNKLIPMVRARSKFVPAGTKYEAEVFLTATSTSLLPGMQVGNQSLKVNGEGIGAYNFMASGGAYTSDGLAKKSWTAQIKMKKPDGGDTVYTVTEEYFVVKPVIQMQSAAMKSLYYNCGNKVDIQVPALGAEYNPEFKGTGITIKKTGTKGSVYLIPTSPTAKISVYNKGQFIDDRTFKVIPIPKPTIEVRVNNQLVNPRTGIKSNELRTISIKAISDPDFASSQPEDATYKVVEWEIEFARGKKFVSGLPKLTPAEQTKNVAESGGSLKDKDIIFVTPKKVMRKTYLGTWEEVRVPQIPTMIPINN